MIHAKKNSAAVKKTFYSNGKLLITAEYVVLDGAKALALPTKFGQNLIVEEGNDNQIQWQSFDADGSIWFEEIILFSEIENLQQFHNASVKNTLVNILHEGFILNPDFIKNSKGYKITTQLSFPKFWGLGTSSTLINNIAQWLEIDAFKLLKNSFGGSGYDIACAQNNSPILYQLENSNPIVKTVVFEPLFKDNLYFVYLNKKQNSKDAIAAYKKKQFNLDDTIESIDNITASLLKTSNVVDFANQLEKHENIMSAILETPTVKASLFQDFKGTVKSLGAWGGDFVMVVSDENPTDYFNKKGYNTILTYKDMIL